MSTRNARAACATDYCDVTAWRNGKLCPECASDPRRPFLLAAQNESPPALAERHVAVVADVRRRLDDAYAQRDLVVEQRDRANVRLEGYRATLTEIARWCGLDKIPEASMELATQVMLMSRELARQNSVVSNDAAKPKPWDVCACGHNNGQHTDSGCKDYLGSFSEPCECLAFRDPTAKTEVCDEH